MSLERDTKNYHSIIQGEMLIRNSIYKNYDELPLFLNADTVAKTLGISISSCYELLHEKDFPKLNIGNRIVVPKEKFIQWVEQNTVGGIS
jgi:excisionase family DNA binding protein